MFVLNNFFYVPLICLGLLTCYPKVLYAQSKFIDVPNEYFIKHYTDQEGLPQNSIKSIAKDSRGYIWLSTDMGLARFDGSEFKTFNNFKNVNSDDRQSVGPFLIDPDRTKNADFFILKDQSAFIRIFDGTAKRDTSIYKKSLESQPFIKSGSKVAVNSLPSISSPYANPDNYVVALGSANYYLCQKEQIEYYSHKKLKKVIKFTNNGSWNFFRLDNFLFHFDEHMQLTRFNGQDENPDKKNITLQGDITKHPLYHASVKYQIFWSNCSNQAFVLLGSSFYRLILTPDGGLTTDLILEKFDFKLNKIITAFFDEIHGKFFLGTQAKGLYVIEKKQFKALRAKTKGTDDVYYGQTVLDKNSILTGQGNLFTLDSASKLISVSQLRSITQATNWDNYSIITDSDGNNWVKGDRTLFKFDHSSKKLLAKWTISSQITLLYEGLRGRIWIGTREHGLHYLDASSPHAIPCAFSVKIPYVISWIQDGKAGELWVGTSNGLYIVSLATGKLTSINGLKNIAIRSLKISAEGDDVWITTYKDGFFLFRNNRLTRFPLDPKGYLANTHCMIEDKKGYFWLPTNKGLFQVLKSDLTAYAKRPFDIYYHYYSKNYGFNSNEFNGGCEPCAVRLNGYISLPSIDGLIWFTPENIHPETPSGKIYVDNVRVNGVMTSCLKDSLIISQPLESISLTLASPFFGDMYNRQIDYTLFQKGKPMVWHPIDNKNMNILIPNLGSGEYTLIIRKKAGFGTNNLEYKKIYIEVEKEWFETTKFWILASLLFALIVYICFWIRTKQIKKRNIWLETQVYTRTLDLQETLKTLNLSKHELKEQVKLHVRLIASISHDIQTPIYQIGEVAKNIEKLILQEKWDDVAKSGKAIEHTSGKIYEMLHNMVNFIKPRVYGTIVDFLPVDVLALTHEKASIFEEILAMKGGKIDIRSACDEKNVITNPNLLGIIIHNLLDNAIKIKKAGSIDIHMKKEQEKLHLVISDQGPGFPSALLNWINNDDSQLPEDYEGLGLLMVKEISKFIKIDIYAENHAGARVHLIFDASTAQ